MKTKRSLSDPLMALKMLLLCEDLTLAERRVGAALLDHRNHRTGRCDPGLERLSRELRIGRRTVIRANAGLEKKGLVRKRRHGGHFHRNGYEFNWERFRELNEVWERHRASVSRKQSYEKLSPCGRQPHHLGGDIETTQTCLSNQSKETYVAASSSQQHTQRNQLLELRKRTGEVARSNDAHSAVNGRFHVKTAPAREVRRDVAERHWNEDLMRRYERDADGLAKAIEVIDDDLKCAATDAEIVQQGGGLALIVQRVASLDRGGGA